MGQAVIGKVVLGVATLFAAGSAQAQYGPRPGPPPAYLPYPDLPTDDRVFAGARAEVHVSYDRLLARLADGDDFAPRRRDGVGYGGEVGYDFAVGGVTLGGYASADGSTIRECQTLPAGTIGAGGDICLRPGRTLAVGGRVGVPVGASTLLFAKGGYSNGVIRLSYGGAPGLDVALRQELNGYHVGAGVETLLSARAYGKLEYLYTRLRRFQDDGDGGTDFDRHQVQAALGVRF